MTALTPPASEDTPVERLPHIWCDGLVKIYQLAELEVVALQGLDLAVERGEVAAIVGASGSGKSTLLNILGGLDTLTAGSARVGGYELGGMDAATRTTYRRDVVGFVWQRTASNLLPYLTVRENIEMPLTFAGMSRRCRRNRVSDLLGLVGVDHRHDHHPGELSGGEQQRAAVAVALANEPEILLADEPTGELDTAAADELFGIIRQSAHELGTTTIVLTHDPLVSDQVERTIAIRDGRTSSETLRRRRLDASGEHTVVAEEYAVLDRAGRLQLPAEYVDALELARRVRIELESDHIGVWPDQEDA